MVPASKPQTNPLDTPQSSAKKDESPKSILKTRGSSPDNSKRQLFNVQPISLTSQIGGMDLIKSLEWQQRYHQSTEDNKRQIINNERTKKAQREC